MAFMMHIFFSDFLRFDISPLLLTLILLGVPNKHCLLSFFITGAKLLGGVLLVGLVLTAGAVLVGASVIILPVLGGIKFHRCTMIDI